jgi:hypothetical protein
MTTDRPRGRTPEEQQRTAVRDARIQAATEHAVETAAMYFVATAYGESTKVRERWLDRVYDHLRDALPPEDLIRAIILLVEDSARDRARELLAMVAESNLDDLLPGPWSKPCDCPRCPPTDSRKGWIKWR